MYESLSNCDLTPKYEIETRIGSLQKKMRENAIDYAVILQNADLFYLTGTLQKGVLVIRVDRPPLFFVERSLERATQESPLEIIPIRKDKDVGEIARKEGVSGTGAMELDVIPVALFERWKSILGSTHMLDISPLIRDLRIIKSEFEIRQIVESGKIITRIFQKAKQVIKAGLREIDIESEIIAEGRRAGHQGFLRMRGLNQEMMPGYVTQGYSATIHSYADVPIAGLGITHAIAQGASNHRIVADIPVIVDYGGGYNGYITDETRVYAIGALKDIFMRGYDVSRKIIEETIAFARSGIDATEIFLRAAEHVRTANLEKYFMGHGEGQVSFAGHGLGLEINELPVITPRHKTQLREGMVFAFEPKFIIPGEGAVGLEVDFIVRKDGLERVTDSPMDIMYV